jgi:hypothetical protein
MYVKDISICDEIINLHETSQQFAGNIDKGIDPDQKDSTDAIFQSGNDLFDRYFDHIMQVVEQYKTKYSAAYYTNNRWGLYEPVLIQRYLPYQGYHSIHCENGGKKPPFCYRHLVFMTYLNSVTDGGHTEFIYQNVSIQPRKGLTLIWPVDWTHSHRGIVSPSQTKYITTGWFSFME